MKKILKTFLWINAVVMFVLGMLVNFNFLNSEDLNLSIQQKEALAFDDCSGGGSGGGVSVTVTCYDKLSYGLFNNDEARPCDITTRCAKKACALYSRPGTCTFTN